MKGDPATAIAQAMAELRSASGEEASAVPQRDPQTQSFGNDPTAPVMAEPGETYVPPEVAQPVLPILKAINNDDDQAENPLMRRLSAMYRAVAKPVRAFSLGMSMLSALSSPVDMLTKTAGGEINPLDLAVTVAEKVANVRRNRGEEMVQENREDAEPQFKEHGGVIQPVQGSSGSDSEPTMMEPGGFVVNSTASAQPENQEFLSNVIAGNPSLFDEPEPQQESPEQQTERIKQQIQAEVEKAKKDQVVQPQQQPAAPEDSVVDVADGEFNASQAKVDAQQSVSPQDQPEHLDMDMSRSQVKPGFDFAKMQRILGTASRIQQVSGSKGINLGWSAAPDFHRALYGRYPEPEKQSQSQKMMGDLNSPDMKKAMMLAGLVLAPELAIPAMAAGGEGAVLSGVLGGEGAALGGMMGGEGAVLSKIFGGGTGATGATGAAGIGGTAGRAGEGMFGGGGIDQLFGMMSDKQGSSGGDAEDMKGLIKAILELVSELKGEGGTDSGPSDSFGPQPSNNGRTQGSNYGAILRNTGR